MGVQGEMSDKKTPLHFETRMRYICIYIDFTHDMSSVHLVHFR